MTKMGVKKMDYKVEQKFISMNRSNVNFNAVGTVVHETSDPGATDENEYNYFNTGNRGASAHAFVDKDSITQTIPWKEKAWHAGPTANSKFIGIELCHFDDAASFAEVWKRAVWLFAYVHSYIIMKPLITKDNLMSHAEVSQRWHETDHRDPISYFGEFGKSVDDFRNEVQSEINIMLGEKIQPAAQIKAWNTDVLALQKTLNRLRITDGHGNTLVEDGIQGPRTREAVKKFQNVSSILIDGIVGTQTLNAINSIVAKPFLSIGSSGSAVRYVQYRVGASIDGIYGPRTRSKIASFQSLNSLSADGTVGSITWNNLIG